MLVLVVMLMVVCSGQVMVLIYVTSGINGKGSVKPQSTRYLVNAPRPRNCFQYKYSVNGHFDRPLEGFLFS